jgi:hypothetical protein
MTALAKIKDAGFTLSLTDTGNIQVIPFSKLTDIQRQYIRQHKAEIIRQLETETESQPEAVITIYPRFVICYTPNGGPIRLLAKDAGHEQLLINMNPKPTVAKESLKSLFTCGTCTHFTPHHAHGKGSGSCDAGVKPSGICHWSETVTECNQHTGIAP